MKKIKVALFICFLLSLNIFSYGNGEEVATAQSTETMSIDMIKEKLTINVNQEQVKSLLGSGYKEVVSAMNGTQMWRFDLGDNENYQFNGFIDEVDITGLKSESLDMQLFIAWNSNGNVEQVSAYYRNKKDQLLHEYRMFSNGDIRDTVIEG